MLRHVPAIGDPRILVDASTRDDAAVYRLSDTRALVATVDFFTPIVDDARTWGRIAAANALSDLYAMGATPMCALSLVGWPREALPLALLGEVLDGMAEITRAAGCPIVGGHTIDALEPHVGLVALGEAHPDRLLTNAGARAGQRLVLTKPLGTGILTTALKRDLLTEADLEVAVRSMTTLNDAAMAAALAHGVTAATDITGFGLLGHLGNILAASGVGAELWLDRLPLLPRARDFAAADVAPGGTRRNLAALTGVSFAPEIDPAARLLLADAQTSGGLLLAVPREGVTGLLGALAAAGTPAQAEIGVLTSEAGMTRVLGRQG